jgi:fructose-bisphosphate aldolase class II/tagatose 1,6-diphosphate aldolase GatY/KbaY
LSIVIKFFASVFLERILKLNFDTIYKIYTLIYIIGGNGMALAKVRDILKCANDNGFAVAAFDIFNYESASWVVKAAEREKIPVILMFYPDMSSYIPLKTIGGLCRLIAENADVPVGVHLDHSRSFELVMSGIPAGFQSIMFDGSSFSYEENIDTTKRVKASAKIFGVDVEAELGVVGSGSNRDDFMDPNKYTTVEMAVEFVEKTDVDSLAVSIGNSHGNYVCEPHLDIKRLSEINSSIDIPLVLHGGSGIPADQVRESIKYGINKVNVATEYNNMMKDVFEQKFINSPHVLSSFDRSGEDMIEFVRERLKWFNPSDYHIS